MPATAETESLAPVERARWAPRVAAALYALPLVVVGVAFFLAGDDAARRFLGGLFLLYAGGMLAFMGTRHAIVRPDPEGAGVEAADRFVSELRRDEPGPVAIEGVVHASSREALVAPLSADRCLWYDVTMERLARGAGGEWGWRVLAREQSAQSFLLEDDSGRVRVLVPRDAALEPVHRFDSVNPLHPRVVAWRASQPQEPGAAASGDAELARQGIEVRFREYRLKAGDLVRVRGSVRAERGELVVEASTAGPPPPLPFTAPAGDDASAPDGVVDVVVPPAHDERALQGAVLSLVGIALVFWGASSVVDAIVTGEAARVAASLAPFLPLP